MDYEQMSRQELIAEIEILVRENTDLGNELGQALHDLDEVADKCDRQSTHYCCFCCTHYKSYECEKESPCGFEWRGV